MSAAVRIWSCRPTERDPMSGSGRLDFSPGAPPDARAFATPDFAPPLLRKGSLSARGICPPLIRIGSRFLPAALSQELAVAGNDRQVDELRPGVVLRRVSDEKAAEIDVVHPLQGVDQALAREIPARAP